MKLKLLVMASLLLTATLTLANNWTYSNGAGNGQYGAVIIGPYFYETSDSYLAGGNAATSFSFLAWESNYNGQSDSLVSVSWVISSGALGGGTQYGSGTATGVNLTDTFLSAVPIDSFYGLDSIAVTGLNVPQTAGRTYWLTLSNVIDSTGNWVYWDVSNGASNATTTEPYIYGLGSESFTISGSSATPEPSSLLLLGSGMLGLAGVFRKKMFS